MNIISEGSTIKEIWTRIRKRDFSGNTGLAIKNSVYQFSTNLAAKIGSLIFTIILARLLLPELFGLYNVALSTILLFVILSDLGVGQTLVRFVSKELGKSNKGNAKSYLFYIGKIKVILISASILILIFSARFISDTYYKKPIFMALIAGLLYLLFTGIISFFQSILQASNYFRGIFYGETIFQVSRIILVPLAVFFALKYSLSNESVLFFIILFLSISYLFALIFMWFVPVKRIGFIKKKKSVLKLKQKKVVNKFLIVVSATAFSSLFFGLVDKIMLGHFVFAEFIGYYSAALSLVSAAASLTGFSAALLPVFSRVNKRQLEKGLKKTINILLIFAVISISVTLLFAPLIVRIIYGSEYSLATNLLRLLSLLLLTFPLIGIYTTYFTSKGKPQVVAKLLIISTIINIILNYFLITSFLRYGNLAAVFGAGLATLTSQFFYLFSLLIARRKNLRGNIHS